MILFRPEHLKSMSDTAENAYPNECCGLIAGHLSEDRIDHIVTQIVPSTNVSQSSHADSFEIDPQVRFDLMRDVEGRGDTIIGHYHSHPDHPAHPSETDLAMAYEPDLLWIILSVCESQVVETRAYRVLPDATAFLPLEISMIDPHRDP